MKKKNVLDIELAKRDSSSSRSSRKLMRYYLGGFLVGKTYQDKFGNQYFESFGHESMVPGLKEAEEGIKRRLALVVIGYLKLGTDVTKYLPKSAKKKTN